MAYFILMKIDTNVKQILHAMLLTMALTNHIQAEPNKKAEETGFLKFIEEHPELTCSAIAAKWAGASMIGGVAAAKGAVTMLSLATSNPLIGSVIVLGATVVSSATFLATYDKCIREKNKNLDT